MSSQVLCVTGVLSASPLAQGERIEVRGSFSPTYKATKPSPYPLPSEGRGKSFSLTT
jgi:hypothetical protein